jgi:iron complex outermembrane receptor protein
MQLGLKIWCVNIFTCIAICALQAQNPTVQDSIPLVQLIKAIEQEQEIYFIYESTLVEDVKVPTLMKSEVSSPLFSKVFSNLKIDVVQIAPQTFTLAKAKEIGTIIGQITNNQGEALAGANIRLTHTNQGTASQIDGQYILSLKAGKWEIEASYVGLKAQKKQFELLNNDTLVLDFQLDGLASLDKVVVVGSRFQESSLLSSASPATIIKADDKANVNYQLLGELLHFQIPSFHSTQQTISDGTDHINPASLRGLGPDQVLVLVNGKRRHSSSLVNINGTVGKGTVATDLDAIPLNAIEKIEVLRDGATAQYGSDAIAGVINIQLKENTNFGDVRTHTGITKAGDGATYKLNANYGFDLGKKGGFLNISADFQHRDIINRSGDYSGKIFGDERDENPLDIALFYDNVPFEEKKVMAVGGAQMSNAGLFFNAELPLFKQLSVYGFGGYSYRRGVSSGFYRFPYQSSKQSGIYPWGFAPELIANIFDNSITLGLKGKARKWAVDFSNTTGRNSFHFGIQNSNNASLGLASPSSSHAGSFSYMENVTNFDINRNFETGLPLSLGFGGEFRVENFKQKKGEEVSWQQYEVADPSGQLREAGMQMFPGFRPENERNRFRYNLGIYADAKLNLAKAYALGLAGRFEYYTDFGSNFSGKLYNRWHLNKKHTLKASVGTGFRAPSMPQIHFSNNSTQFFSSMNGLEGIDVVHYSNDSPVLRALGVGSLKAEKSLNISAAWAYQAFDGLSFTLDAYQINIYDRIVISGRFSGDLSAAFAEILSPLGVDRVQFFTNAIDTRTYGMDAGMHYETPFFNGKLHWSVFYNFNETRLRTDADGMPIIRATGILEGFENILLNREEISRIEKALPRDKWMSSLQFQSKRWTASLAVTRFGSLSYIHAADGHPANWITNEYTGLKESRDQRFSPKWTTDMSIGYKISSAVELTIGGTNIFDVYPDRHQHSANIGNGIFVYSRRVQQFGIQGAYYFLQCHFRW